MDSMQVLNVKMLMLQNKQEVGQMWPVSCSQGTPALDHMVKLSNHLLANFFHILVPYFCHIYRAKGQLETNQPLVTFSILTLRFPSRLQVELLQRKYKSHSHADETTATLLSPV